MTAMPSTATGLRLLVFGLPGSGKSSLLGALVQAAGAQAAVLKGKLADDTGQLTALRQRVYAGAPPATAEAVVAYPVHFVPLDAAGGGVAATLFDCDGRVAQGYLAGKRPLEPRDSDLAREMLAADTVILTLDAAAAGSQVEAHLSAFRRFLTRLEAARGGRADVADLPVYLVLTKCDQLAKPDDSFSKWLQRIEEAKRRLGERFTTFLGDDPGAAFGTVDLQLWATAVRRPALADRPAQDGDPYGVAELFRQCLASAASFDRREHRASRRLELTVGGLGFMVIVLTLLAGLFLASRPDTALTHLEEQVQTAVPEADAPADRRLRGPLPERLAQLEAIEQDPAFGKLPAHTQEAVRQSAAEIAAYVATSRDFRANMRQPYQAKDEAEFDRFERQVQELALPPKYAAAWADTRLARTLTATRREYAAVRSAVAAEVQWIGERIAEGKQLRTKATTTVIPALGDPDPARVQAGRKQADAWIAAYAKYVNRPYLRLPGDQPIAGTAAYTYADLRRFRAVRQARKEWDQAKEQLNETYRYVAKLTAR